MKYKLKLTQSIKRRTFANVRPYMPLKWLPVIAGYTRIRKTAGYAGGYLFVERKSGILVSAERLFKLIDSLL